MQRSRQDRKKLGNTPNKWNEEVLSPEPSTPTPTHDPREIVYCRKLLAAEVTSNKNCLKPDQSKMEEK